MSDPIPAALERARRVRADGRRDEAERAYARAAELARLCGGDRLLAHALRHLSELALERGGAPAAWEHASEAVALYRAGSDELGLANAIRLVALSSADQEEARACWKEARDLYASLKVTSGVSECDTRLAGRVGGDQAKTS